MMVLSHLDTEKEDPVTDRSPAYVQLTAALRELALAHPWETDEPLPPENELASRYNVSRGTLRRATHELVREGLLSSEPGRGTYVRRAMQLRMRMRETLAEIALPDSRWHLDVLYFVPDFVGSEECRQILRGRPEYASADLLLVAPDNSLQGVIEQALADGKSVLVPTYGLRRGFVLLRSESVPAEHRQFASTLDGLERFGEVMTVDALRALPPVSLIVTGAIALTRQGVHVGSGRAYIDLEWGILASLGLADAETAVVGVVHDRQLVDVPLTPGPFDVTMDLVITPSGAHEVGHGRQRPAGLAWNAILDSQIEEIAYLGELRPSEYRKGSTP